MRRPPGDRLQPRAEARTVNSSILLNPVLLYSIVWLGAVLLCWAGFASFMGPVSPRFLTFVVGDIVASAIAYVTVIALTSDSRAAKLAPESRRMRAIPLTVQSALERYSNILFALWAVGSVINAFASNGLPIIWRLQGSERSYADYGIPTFSGLIAACGLFASMGFFLLQRVRGNKRRWWAIALVLVYQVAIFNRGGAVWLVLELAGIYLQIGRFGLGRMVRGAALLLVLIIFFGQMGNARTGRDTETMLRSMATDRGAAVFEHLPSGFWWTYLYASVGSVNLNAAMDHVVPLGHPYWSVTGLFPTVVRSLIYTETTYEARYPLEMVNGVFNVFTFYGGYIADFGLAGCYGITFVLQLLASYYFLKAKRGDVPSIIAYSVCFQIIVISLFTDSLTSWVALFQFVLAFAFRFFVRRGVPIPRLPEAMVSS
jgi:oligosaccharide repeat unit polymerase